MEEIIEYDSLWESGMKCKHGVLWKPSVMHFNLNAVEEVYRMEKKLKDGTWKNGKPRPIQILYPKKRDGLSIAIRDRVYQRSINDNVLYPAMTRTFIFDNCACQKGKGIDYARKRLKKHLWNHYMKYGASGYILQIDIKGYYPNMQHRAVKEKFRRNLDDDTYRRVCDVLDTQYAGAVGYNPGSQMVQIAGISLLDDLDHYCKERLRAKYYIRYMDDILILHHDKAELQKMLDAIEVQLAEIGFRLNTKKTHITPLRQGFLFLGFIYHMTETGKVIMTLNSDNIRHERRKLRRMVSLAKRGIITRAKVEECYGSWKANASKGNTFKMVQRMDQYYQELWRNNNGQSTASKHREDDGRRNRCG